MVFYTATGDSKTALKQLHFVIYQKRLQSFTFISKTRLWAIRSQSRGPGQETLRHFPRPNPRNFSRPKLRDGT